MDCWIKLRLFEKWDVSIRLIQIFIAASTLGVGFCTYQENKLKDRKTLILQYCTSTNTIPLNIKVAAETLQKRKDKKSFDAYRMAMHEFLSRLEVENTKMKSISSRVLSFIPAIHQGEPSFKELLIQKNINEDDFIPNLIEELKSIQKNAIESCVRRRIESL